VFFLFASRRWRTFCLLWSKTLKNKYKSYKKILLILIVGALTYKCYAQELSGFNKNFIKKNIISFHLRHALDHELELKKGNVLAGKIPFFEKYLQREGNDLVIEFKESHIEYPKSGYKIYQIKKKDLIFSQDSTLKYYTFNSFFFDEDYLVAVDSGDKNIQFLSENFFLTAIANDFALDKNRPSTFNSYLKIRFNHIGANGIKYLKKKKGQLVFKAYSEIAKQDVNLYVDEYDFDNVKFSLLKKIYIY
jgi:hypothetical protein